MRKKTPQEKKALSYQHDRRNIGIGSPKASRRLIPLRKKLRNRVNRRLQNIPLTKVQGVVDSDFAEEMESAVLAKAPCIWEKIPDVPLGELTNKRREERQTMTKQGGRQSLRRFFTWDELNRKKEDS